MKVGQGQANPFTSQLITYERFVSPLRPVHPVVMSCSDIWLCPDINSRWLDVTSEENFSVLDESPVCAAIQTDPHI